MSNKNLHNHKFISVEGIEGAGKTTVINLLKDYLSDLKQDVVITREPGGTPVGEEIRNILLNHKGDLNLNTELLLIVAARVEHFAKVIKPALDSGKIVICDRYIDSTYAYQGAGRGIDDKIITSIHNFLLQDYLPHLTILCDIPIDISRQRLKQRGSATDNFEKLNDDFFIKARNRFLERANSEPKRFLVIDSSDTLENIKKIISSIAL